jgi:hypothetical protein
MGEEARRDEKGEAAIQLVSFSYIFSAEQQGQLQDWY